MLSRRMFLSYLLILLILSVTMAAGFYIYSRHSMEEAAMSSLENLSVSTMAQVDSLIKMMDDASIFISTADAFQSGMQEWNARGIAPDPLKRAIQTGLQQAMMPRQSIYRVCLFTPDGKAISFGRNDLQPADVRAMLQQPQWLEISHGINAKRLLSPHLDPWVKENPVSVISIVRSFYLEGVPLGYMEVQIQADALSSTCRNTWNGNPIYFGILDGQGSIFMSDFPPDNNDGWTSEILLHAPWYPGSGIDTGGEIMSIANSNNMDWKLALVLRKEDVLSGLVAVRNGLFTALALVVGVSALLFRFLAEQQTKPLYKVIKRLESIDIDSLEAPPEPISGTSEVVALQRAFGVMQSRLRESIGRQKALEALQSKALYDALQSRIGPHFLYNTLGSIANMCERGDADAAAEACYNLSDILRYSSHYFQKLVVLEQEMESLGYYLSLMKGRYQHRLEYTLQVDPTLYRIKLPKLSLQPLVENALKYSLTEQEKVLVRLDIQKENAAYVRIAVSDNGIGFDEEKLAAIRANVEAVARDPAAFSWDESMGFGGMGLTGTLIRFYLYFGDEFSYEIISAPYNKVEVVLHIPRKEENNPVQSDDR